jgi:hypothetical protein
MMDGKEINRCATFPLEDCMRHEKLGKTGLDVSVVTLGCMSFGEAGGRGRPWTLDEAACRDIIRQALDAGINFFDTANVYSSGRSDAKALYLADLHGWTRFVSMQNHYNLIYREEEREMLPLCADEGIGVIPWSPLARGKLTRPWDEATTRKETDDFGKTLYRDEDRAIVERVLELAAKRDVSPGPGRPGLAAAQPGGDLPHRRRHQAVAPVRRDRRGGRRPRRRRGRLPGGAVRPAHRGRPSVTRAAAGAAGTGKAAGHCPHAGRPAAAHHPPGTARSIDG